MKHPDLKTVFTATAAAGLLLLCAGPARADKKEFMALTQQIATLQGQVAEAEQARADTQRDLKKIVDMLVEQSALIKRLQQDLKIQDERAMVAIKDQQERLSEISDRLRGASIGAPAAATNPPLQNMTVPSAGAAAAVPPSGVSTPPAPAAPALGPRELYQQAYSDFARKNYELSIQGFQDYLRLYRDTDLGDNAQYWIGECLAAQSKYEDAVNAFNALLRDFPASDKIPDARYKKGVALDALGRKSQAVLEYRFVVERFPGSPAARLAREKLGQQQ